MPNLYPNQATEVNHAVQRIISENKNYAHPNMQLLLKRAGDRLANGDLADTMGTGLIFANQARRGFESCDPEELVVSLLSYAGAAQNLESNLTQHGAAVLEIGMEVFRSLTLEAATHIRRCRDVITSIRCQLPQDTFDVNGRNGSESKQL